MTRPSLLFAILLACVGCPPEPTTNTPTPTPEPTPTPTPAAAKQGETCEAGLCEDGLTCVKYYGIAGPSGPQFTSCEIPCPDEKSTCPQGQQCITIADGPGRVCRPPQP